MEWLFPLKYLIDEKIDDTHISTYLPALIMTYLLKSENIEDERLMIN